MLNKAIGFNQHFSLFLKIMRIVLLFALTSCPIKASIQQNLYQDVKTETANNKIARADPWMDYDVVDCSEVDEQIKAHDFVVKESQIQPTVLFLLSFALILLTFLPRKVEKLIYWNAPKNNSNNLFLQYRRL